MSWLKVGWFEAIDLMKKVVLHVLDRGHRVRQEQAKVLESLNIHLMIAMIPEAVSG